MTNTPQWFARAQEQIASTGYRDAMALTTAYWTPNAPDAPDVVADAIAPTGDIDRARAVAMMLAQAWMMRAAIRALAQERRHTFAQELRAIARTCGALSDD